MRIRVAIPDDHVTPENIEPVLEAVTRVNESLIAAGHSPTSYELLDRGAKWRPEAPGDEHFDHGATIQERGWGDCDDWAPLHAATLRATGEDPGATARIVRSGEHTYHAIVERSDKSIEDPSIAAGMKSSRPSNINGEGENAPPNVWVCDPHDGRIYQGALAPSVGPLSLHCGPGIAVRGCVVKGAGPLYEARIDVPLHGAALVGARHRSRRHRATVRGTPYVHGLIPAAISVTHRSRHVSHAVHGAICGAMYVGDASNMTSALDQYKLQALNLAMKGATPGQVHDALVKQMHADLVEKSKQSGLHPEDHAAELLAQTLPPGVHGEEYVSVHGFFSSLAHIASSVVSDVSKVAKSVIPKGVMADINKVTSAVSSVTKLVGPWAGDILHGVEAAVSVIPGLGTAVSDVVAAAETAFDTASALLHGNPFEAAIKAAYNFATATIPGASGLRFILDPVVNGLIAITVKKEPIESAVLDGILSKVPDSPKFGSLSPRSVAASIAHLIVGHLGVRHNPATAKPPQSRPASPPPPPPHANVLHAPLIVQPQLRPPPPPVVVVPTVPLPLPSHHGRAHAAMHAATLSPVDVVTQAI
ncbi:MAG TPA: hypothetical protein VFE26_10900 [Trebonia sp.]|jgi:hypothetical protein|nr:hypothetical protein [Trebonia sp.]